MHHSPRDQKEQILSKQKVNLVKVKWLNHSEQEATNEQEKEKEREPNLFHNPMTISLKDNFFKGDKIVVTIILKL